MTMTAAAAEAPPRIPVQRWTENGLGATLTILAVAWALELPQRLNLALFNEQFLAGVLTLVLPLAFLTSSVHRKRTGRASWVDLVLALASALIAGYVAVRYPEMQGRLVYRPLDGVILSAALLFLVLEAVRRCCGWALLLIVLAFVVYALVGQFIPGMLASRPIQWDRLAVYLAMDTNALIGTPLLVAAEVVIPFILMGQILNRGGGANFFNDIALAAAGRSRGGGGKIAVVSSLLFGFVSGSAVANVVSGGIITIPLMMRSGMRADRAAAVEAVSSTGGQLVPPVMGAAAFLMAEFLGVPYREVALAALAPSILFYLALYVWCDFAAGRDGLALVDASQIPRVGPVLKAGWHYTLPFIALFIALFWWNWSAQLAALFGCGILYVSCTLFGYQPGRRMTRGDIVWSACSIAAGLLAGVGAFRLGWPDPLAALFGCAIAYAAGMLFGYSRRRMKGRDLLWTISSTGTSVLEVVVICAGAGLVIGVLNLAGLAFGLTLYLGQLAEANVFVLLLVTAGISIVLGMGMPTVAVYVLVAALIAPSMIKAGLDPLAAHMFLLYFGMLSMITPPVALASFAAASIAKADFWRTGWEGVKIGWIAYILPFVFIFQPSSLFRGDLWTGIWELATSCFGVVLGTAAVVGYARGPLTWPLRLAAAGAAVLLFIPSESLPAGAVSVYAEAVRLWLLDHAGLSLRPGMVVNLVGVVLGIAIFAVDRGRVQRAGSSSASSAA
jgi:TRAP transporter 4TM/12TM fusion protein